MAKETQSLHVDRKDKDSRALILQSITESQKDFIEGRNLTPLLIFPEGTASSGRHLLKFNKGSFYKSLAC
jgi:1-acyl-sn-glycerol-3-phosphate acyltransferase